MTSQPTTDLTTIKVTSAQALDDTIQQEIASQLKVDVSDIQFIVDDRLIAGVRLQGPGLYFDNSMQGQLQAVYDHLTQDGDR